MKILVLNAGSSSVKYQLFNMESKAVLASGLVEQIGEGESTAKIKYIDNNGNEQKFEQKSFIKDHDEALGWLSDVLVRFGVLKSLNELGGIGHRVVQGGAVFSAPTLVDENVLVEIEKLIPLAPLHNPGHLAGMRVAMRQSPDVPQVAVFDTAFHATLPQYAYMYAIPYRYFEELQVRRYGFHGTSHGYVAKEAAKFLGKDFATFNAITLHLGNGASVAAIENGKCVDTSMGLTPLEGLVMGTRSGDIDPAVLFYIASKEGKTLEDFNTMLNKQSGLKGICGSNDMREISKMAEEGDSRAQLARKMFSYRLKKYIGSYSAALGRVDALIFTGGIGENDNDARLKACENLSNLGIIIDEEENAKRLGETRVISTKESRVKVLVVPTNEELEIALQTLNLIKK